MVVRLVSTALVANLLVLSACSKAPSKAKFGIGSDALPDGVTQDAYKETEDLHLSSVAAEDAGPKAFDFTKTMEVAWVSAHEVVMSRSDGQNISYDFSTKAWTAVHTSDLRSEFQDIYDFRDAGFFAENAEGFSLKSGSDGKIVRLALADDFDEKNLVGVNPGFLAYKAGSTIKVVVASGDSAKLYPLTDAPSGLTLVYPCNLNCVVWGYNGKTISLYIDGKGWISLNQVVELPSGESIKRMAIRFRKENNPIAAEAILLQTEKGTIYAQVASSAPKVTATWEDIRALSETYCVACHLEDGYDKESTWTGLKSSIVERLSADPGSKGAMPPIETKIGQQLSSGERATMLAWIEKQEQTERGEVGNTGTTQDNPISGDLKTLAEAHCLSCHGDGKTTSWWVKYKGDSISRINSGNMPKGKTLSDSVRKQFETAINAVK